MTTDLRLFDITFKASGDNTDNQYKGVFATSSVNASGEVAVVATHGGKFVGVLQDKSTAAGIASLVRVAGITKMQAGASSGMEIEDDDSLKARVMKLFGLTPTSPVTDPDVPEAVRKVIDEVKGAVTKADERADAAEERLKKAEDLIIKRDREARVQLMVSKAAKYAKMGTADDLSKLLTDAQEKLGDEGLKSVETILAKGQEAFDQAQLFKEIGVVPRGEQHDNAIAKVDAKAEEIQKADPKMTIEAARAKAWKDDPELYKEYQSERRRQLQAARED